MKGMSAHFMKTVLTVAYSKQACRWLVPVPWQIFKFIEIETISEL